MHHSPPHSSQKQLLLLVSALVCVAAALRLPDLDLKPLHSDEGVNGWFTLRLRWWNLYRYRPSDYHGPFLYYVNLLFFRLLGPSEISLRLGTALAGVLVPLALVPLSRYLGLLGLGSAALLLATSPTMVYFARTNIHETWLVLGTILWAAGLLRYCSAPRMRWALMAAAGAALCFVNKETAVITGASLLAGLGLAWLVGDRRAAGQSVDDPDLFSAKTRSAALRSWWSGQRGPILAGSLLFVGLIVLFFSSMGTWMPGLVGFFEAFGLWVEHGVSGRNQGQDWDYFFTLMLATEGPFLLVAGFVSAVWAVSRRHRTGLFLCGWTVSAALAYSLIPYKTPWCVLSIELPLLISCGWLAQQWALLVRDSLQRALWRAVAVVGVAALLLSAIPMAAASIEVSSDRFDADQIPYVFVQTGREYYEFLQDLFGVGDQVQFVEGRRPKVVNIDPKNPTRWYTITRGWRYDRGDYLNGKLPDVARLSGAEVVLCTGKNVRAISKLLEREGGGWHQEVYALRPGVKLWAWFRAPWWAAYQRAGGRSASPWPRPPVTDIWRPPLPAAYR